MEQGIYVCEEYNNFPDSKSTITLSDFKVFLIMFLRQLNFDVLSVWQLFYVYWKLINPIFFNLQFFLLLSEKRLSPKNCLAIRYPSLVAYKVVAYKKVLTASCIFEPWSPSLKKKRPSRKVYYLSQLMDLDSWKNRFLFLSSHIQGFFCFLKALNGFSV